MTAGKSHRQRRRGTRLISRSQVLKIAAAAAALGLTMGIKPAALFAGDPHEAAAHKQKQHGPIATNRSDFKPRPGPNAIYMKFEAHKQPPRPKPNAFDTYMAHKQPPRPGPKEPK